MLSDDIMDSVLASSTTASFPYPVHTGFWTNCSHGRVLGATLTLRQNDANLLIAFVALFAALVAGHMWRILCFGIHAYYSTAKARDFIYHQQQALLRNSSGAVSSAFALIELGWAWRKLPIAWRLLPLIALTLLLGIFLALSGFSSKVATGNEVLILGTHCGIPLSPAFVNDSVEFGDYEPYIAGFYHGSGYTSSRMLYYSVVENDESEGWLRCLYQPWINPDIDRNASCPFGVSCLNESGNLLLDTVFLDSHEDFGVNTPRNERSWTGRLSHCAPLKTEGHNDMFNTSRDRSYTRWYYGNAPTTNLT
ncbi:Uu.00g106010.m01.CDS01 [Anthostomella pinea]|uniref:Uu.00g106010.m01.CDS01 n=1 Tax=Anthostomella pinea TaxID=933095 RepID=A0AAI8YFU7_9PEZI|nr:Uu.00g106010.m01.CDS01 [Anthostomella pinea]